MKLRPDIQALRGIAVLVVVLFHARLGLANGGYLGVDIFFVISGFLITSMVRRRIEKGSFSFSDFYTRRAKRLLPAAYVTFFVTAVLSISLLTSAELQQFAGQLLGAVTFTANIVLWRQGSYFGGDAGLKPLLHTWSLSIEEQYYMVLPALLFFLPRRYWKPAVIFALVSSLLLCLGLGLWKPAAAFYFFPTRGWELAIGSFGGLLDLERRAVARIRRMFWPAVVVLFAIPVFPFGGLHPGLDVFLVCVATLIIILSAEERLFDNRAVTALAFVGDFSYSLYLIHWPLLSLVSNLWLGAAPLWARLTGLGLAFPLSYWQYRYVENPVRRAKFRFTAPRLAFTLAISSALAAIPFVYSWSNRAIANYAFMRRGNVGLDQSCAFDRAFVARPRCETSPNPTMLIWGDSYAMHLVPGINATRGNESIVQATKYVCGPLLGLAPRGILTGTDQNRSWADGCLDFNESVLKYLAATPSIRTVVLSSVFKQYMTSEEFHVIRRTPQGEIETTGGVDEAVQGMRATVEAIRALGRRVVVVAPPPALDWDAGLCAERKLRNMRTFGEFRNCEIPLRAYLVKRATVLTFLRRLPSEAGANVIRFDRTLFDGTGFNPIDDGKILYIANGHFSYDGSVYAAKKSKLTARILKFAK